jgi:hypothetical protein
MSVFTPENLTQAINPWTWWTKVSDNVTGLVNINMYKTGDLEAEHRIIREVAGYGRQLNRIEKLLEAFLDTLPESKFNPAQKKAVAEFKEMMSAIHATKAQMFLDRAGVDGVAAALKTLKQKDPEGYKAATRHLKDALKEEG